MQYSGKYGNFRKLKMFLVWQTHGRGALFLLEQHVPTGYSYNEGHLEL